jgi:two-component system cell cycle response regulator CtrA
MEEPEMKTIDVIICRLRKKLTVAGVPTLIDTVWGCGYILRDPSEAPEDTAAQPAWASHVAVAA